MPLEKLPTKMSAGFGLSMIDRAVKESFADRCPTAQLSQIRRYFEANGGLSCLYCRQAPATRWDHLHPVSRGGDTVPGNLVPACGSCDDSKQDRDVEDWLASASEKRPPIGEQARIVAEVEAYRTHFQYVPRSFEDKLSPQQLVTYRAFQEELRALRSHLEAANLLKARQ